MTDRYRQQISVPEVGTKGQELLADARVLVVGAGGLGTPVASTLAAAGIGRITLVDRDRVEASNLHRQILFGPGDIGQPKAAALRAKLVMQNAEVRIDAVAEQLDASNADRLIGAHHIVCDCTDDLSTRVLIDRTCGTRERPLVFAAVQGWQGYLTVLHATKGIHLAQAFDLDQFHAQAIRNCAADGVMPTASQTIGVLQANEVMKLILGIADTLDGYLLCADLKRVIFRKFILHGVAAVPVRQQGTNTR